MEYLANGIVNWFIRMPENMNSQLTKYYFPGKKVIKYNTKDIILPRGYSADFVVYDTIILEVKAIESITSSHIYPLRSGFWNFRARVCQKF